ncbi:MAG: ribosome maturation factor RimM [Cyanobacteria bacterium RUI128]|nr:ribosome maturation factor RimM [Cyanobacteria bacterium RUI128]
MTKYVSVGKILNFHGVKGEAKVGYSKSQKDFMESLEHVYILKDNEYLPFDILSIKFNSKFALLKFSGIDSVNEIVEYKNCLIFVKEEEIREKLDEDEFLIDELVGMAVYCAEKQVGVVIGVSNNGASDLLSVKANSGNICLVPFVKAIVLDVIIKEKKVIVDNIQGLIE